MTERFGHFELDRLLGRGGMAEAFIARRAGEPERAPLVLKRIRPDHAHSQEYLRRFVFEAQVASRVVHPNLVRFLEFGRVGDCHYIAMEKVRGWSLQRLFEVVFVKGPPPPVDAALSLGAGILDALAAMHDVRDEAGSPRPMLHRDVTPANVIIAEDGHPVIIDFGISKDVMGPALTLPGKVIGTARYMSPEHKRAEFLDTRADVFSASVILFELLFGRHPWTPLPGIKELLRVVFDPPAFSAEEEARVPERVRRLIVEGLSADREARPADAAAMRDALLAGFAGGDPEAARAAAATWARAIGLPFDEDLAEPVIDLKPAEGDEEEVVWTADGALRNTGEERPLDPTALAAAAKVLDLPPLPPRRDSALEHGTADLALQAAIPHRPSRLWLSLGIAGLLFIALVLALLLSR